MNHKRYLTGIDWLIHAFDHMNKKRIGQGNVFHVVLEVDGLLDSELFEQKLNQVMSQHAFFKGRASRAFNLAPYWKMDQEIAPVVVTTERIQDAFRLIPCLTEAFIKTSRNRNDFLQGHMVFHENKTFLALSFSHKLFDGIGAELFVEILEKHIEDKQGCQVPDEPLEPSHLSEWREKFAAGRDVNRMFRELSPGGNIRALSLPAESPGYQYQVIQFDEQQTDRIMIRANQEAGYLLIMPFLLSRTVRAVHQLFNRKGIQNSNMVVPVTLNARKKTEERMTFFNHLSFLFFKFNEAEAADPVGPIKNQLYEQTRSQFADKFRANAMLMRILPVSILNRLLGVYSKGRMASFSFSYLGETALKGRKLFGKEISNVFHLPCPSVPPGLGVIVNKCQGRLNLTISYLRGLLDDEDIAFLVNSLKDMPNE